MRITEEKIQVVELLADIVSFIKTNGDGSVLKEAADTFAQAKSLYEAAEAADKSAQKKLDKAQKLADETAVEKENLKVADEEFEGKRLAHDEKVANDKDALAAERNDLKVIAQSLSEKETDMNIKIQEAEKIIAEYDARLLALGEKEAVLTEKLEKLKAVAGE